MTPELAGRHLWHLRDAWEGACLCRSRILGAVGAAPSLGPSTFGPIIDLTAVDTRHDHRYYAWEAIRVMKIAGKVARSGLATSDIDGAVAQLYEAAPSLKSFRDSTTHPEDNRRADDVSYGSSAVRTLAGGSVEYLLDTRGRTHEELGRLVAITEAALGSLVPSQGTDATGPAPPAR